MTNQNKKAHKALVREVMAERGVNYTTAKRSVDEATALLDRAGAERTDAAIWKVVRGEYVVDEWHQVSGPSPETEQLLNHLRAVSRMGTALPFRYYIGPGRPEGPAGRVGAYVHGGRDPKLGADRGDVARPGCAGHD